MNKKGATASVLVMIILSWVHAVAPEGLPPPQGSVWLATVINSPNADLVGESHYNAFHNGTVYVSGEWYVLKDSLYLDVNGIIFFLILRHPDSQELGRIV